MAAESRVPEKLYRRGWKLPKREGWILLHSRTFLLIPRGVRRTRRRKKKEDTKFANKCISGRGLVLPAKILHGKKLLLLSITIPTASVLIPSFHTISRNWFSSRERNKKERHEFNWIIIRNLEIKNLSSRFHSTFIRIVRIWEARPITRRLILLKLCEDIKEWGNLKVIGRE